MKKFLSNLLFTLLLGALNVQAQTPLTQYQFSTGTDASQWMTLSNSATTLLSNSGDNVASSVAPIGFDFQFGSEVYTQFSVNTNGTLHFGATPISTTWASNGGFSPSDISFDLPKIEGFGGYGYLRPDGYIKYELKTLESGQVLVIEFKLSDYFMGTYSSRIQYQIQLYDNNDIKFVYGPTSLDSSPLLFQIGMASSATDIVRIQTLDHTMEVGTSPDYLETWPDANRYYYFFNPMCVGPTELSLDNLTDNSADFTWLEGGGESSWQYTCVLHDSVPDWSDATVTSSTIANVSGLEFGASYDFYIRSICSEGDTSNPVIKSFQTDCILYPIPFTENFDNYTVDVATNENSPSNYPYHAMPICWTYSPMSIVVWGGSCIWLTNYAGDGYHDSQIIEGNSMYFTTTMGQPSYAILPQLEQHVGSLMLSFDYMLGRSSDKIIIGVVTDPNDFETFTALDTVLMSEEDISHVNHIFSDDNLILDSTYYITISINSVNNSHASIDNIVVDYIPSCLIPNGVTMSEIEPTSATVSWTMTPAISYEVAYCPTDSETWNSVVVTDTFAVLTDLLSAKDYQLKVRAICSDIDTSDWCYPIHFTTECAIQTMPFFEDFSDVTGSLKSIYCWDFYEGWASGALNGTEIPSGRYSSWVLEDTQSLGHANACVNVFGTSCNEWLVTPTITIEDHAELSFELAFCAFNSENEHFTGNIADDKFYVMATADSGASWTAIATWGSAESDNYSMGDILPTATTITLPLDQFLNHDIRIAFYVESTEYGGDNDLHISNISVDYGTVQCEIPILKTPQTSQYEAVISWSGTSEQYEIMITETATEIWNDTIVVDDSTYTFVDLQPMTEYSYRVRQICGEDVYSEWSVGTFTTEQVICDVPIINISNITTTEATVTCSNADDVDLMEYQIVSGEDTLSGEVTENPFSIENLTENTTYQIRVRTECVEDVFSEWSEWVTFQTEYVPEGIDDINGNYYFNIYPNPSAGYTTIDLSGIEGIVMINVVDLNGRIVKSINVDVNGAIEQTIDVRQLSQGTYFVQVVGEAINSVRKLIIK